MRCWMDERRLWRDVGKDELAMIGNELHLGKFLQEAAESNGAAVVVDPLYGESGRVACFTVDDERGMVIACVGVEPADGDIGLDEMLEKRDALEDKRAYFVCAGKFGMRDISKAVPVSRAVVGDDGQLLLII